MTLATKIAIRNQLLYHRLYWLWRVEEWVETKVRQGLCRHNWVMCRLRVKCLKCGKRI